MFSEDHILYLNGNGSSKSILAIGCKTNLTIETENGAFDKFSMFINDNAKEYVFGYLGYDLKNDLEELSSENAESIHMPIAYLFVPKHIAYISDDRVNELLKGDQNVIENQLIEIKGKTESKSLKKDQILSSITKESYLQKIAKIKQHIHQGDIYEANFCYPFKSENIELNPLGVYQKLNRKTIAPFSVYAQFNDYFVLSASPERFVKKEGNKVISQPIKGTIKRGGTSEEDQLLIDTLASNQKDRSENVMIVDLVRNDLSRIAKPSSVKVEELCKIYTFKNIHQMISTVTAEVGDVSIVDVLKALFPMGSMTGAPKIRAMQLMEQYEEHKRGLYSGCIGYFAPNGDFDFNVVIRTILYNRKEKKLSFSVGGAITDLSLPEQEYEETLLKAEALIQALTE